jgi:hypothetical protein
MSSAFAIGNIQHALQALKEKIPPHEWADTPLPVIVAPGWWLEDVRKDLGVEEGHEPAEIHGCNVMREDTLNEPMLLDWDGKLYPVLPAWMRASKSAKREAEDGSGETD